MARTIQSPGVEIREVDFTTRAATVEGTNVFLAGFANQGPIDEVLSPSTLSEFEQIYGTPTNSAEQYFYHTAKALYASPAKVITTRIPYGVQSGDGFSSKYGALVYPVRAFIFFNLEYALSEDQVYVSNNGVEYTDGILSIDITNKNTATVHFLSSNNVFVSETRNYPVQLLDGTVIALTGGLATINTGLCASDITYFFGQPTHLELTEKEYEDVRLNNIDWSDTPTVISKTPFTYNNIGEAGLVIINKSQTTINTSYEGYYIGAIDNSNNNPATDFNGIISVTSTNKEDSSQHTSEYVTLPTSRLGFSLSATKYGDGNSVSEILENLSEFDVSDDSFKDTVSLGLFKLRKSVYSPDTNTLEFTPVETYLGSLDYHRQIGDQQGGQAKTFYIREQIENESKNISLVVNPYISNRYGSGWADNTGKITKKARFLTNQLKDGITAAGFQTSEDEYLKRVGASKQAVNVLCNALGTADSLFSLGVYQSNLQTGKDIGNLPAKLVRSFDLVDTPDLYPINLAIEAGLGTIYVNAVSQTTGNGNTGPFVDSKPLTNLDKLYTTNTELTNTDGLKIRTDYTAIANVFLDAAEKQRKDFMVILDPLRNIFVQGANSKVINSKKIGNDVTNFGQHIFWPIRHLYSTINSSYAAAYSTWAQVADVISNRQVWVPFSGFAAATMANSDANTQPWYAPAGFTRGVLTGINDIGVYPKQKQRDQLYKAGINPVAFFPSDGFVIFGQKTLLKRPSAFDRINVRRMFLALEIAVRDTMKYFVFEPNTLFTRTRIVNTLSPLFEVAKNSEGIYDYLIVCDERNNTPDVIDNNELKVDIYIKPVRTAEFILVSFFATKTSQNFTELVGN